MALAHLVSAGAQGSGPVTSVTTAAINTTGADLIVVTYSRFSGAGPAATPITDSAGNTWVASIAEQVTAGVGVAFVRQFHVASPITSATHTFTFTLAAADFPSIAVSAFSGAPASSPLDQTATGTDTTSPHNSPNTAALSQANEVVVGSYTDDNVAEGIALGTGYSLGFVADGDAVRQSIGQEWKIVSSTAAVQSAFTTTANQNSADQVATYKEAAATATHAGWMGAGGWF